MLAPLAFGALTGLALGLTGGGGTMLALPLLMLGLGLPAHEAATLALVAVGAMALVGALARWHAHQLQLHLGLVFALAGMAGAPLGAWGARHVPASVLTAGVALISVVVAVRIWRHGRPLPTTSAALPAGALLAEAACRSDAAGHLRLTGHCLRLLVPVGVLTGVISGLFGVGGGFVVVPALVLIAGIDIRQATGTALLVVALVCGSGAATALAAGQYLDLPLTLWFVAGGVIGLEGGSRIGRRLPVPLVQRLFAVLLLLAAAALILLSLLSYFHRGAE